MRSSHINWRNFPTILVYFHRSQYSCRSKFMRKTEKSDGTMKTSKWLAKINAAPIQFLSGVFITIIKNCYSLSYIQNEPDGWCLLFVREYDEDNEYVWRGNSTFWNRYFTKENTQKRTNTRTRMWKKSTLGTSTENNISKIIDWWLRCACSLNYITVNKSLNAMSLCRQWKSFCLNC